MLKILSKSEMPDYEEFYSNNYNRVFHYVKNKTNSIEDAEDLVSEIFLYCYSHYTDYDPEKSSITTWLYLIVNSRIKNYYRNHNITYVDYEIVSETMQDQSIDLQEGVYLEQLHAALMKAIKRLPERQQKIVIMRYFNNCSCGEIAAHLCITPGNVRVLLSRALDKLSKLNDDYWKEFKNNG